MDTVTQALIGAAAAQCGAKSTHLRMAALAGAIGGLLPDADVLIRSPADPLLFLDYHRHFTHSLVFIPVVAVLAAVITRWVSRGRWPLRALLLPCALGVATHGLLDSCTSYGTHLLWPFSDTRVAWHIISIVDPLFTLPLLIGVVWACLKQQRKAAIIAGVVAAAYMGLCVIQQHRAEGVQAELVAARGHVAARVQVKPAFGNNVLFRAFYSHDDRYQVDAIRVPWWGEPTVYSGESTPVLDLAAYQDRNALDELRRGDIDRFRVFSGDHIIEDPNRCGVLSDFRYAALPDQISPLWGIDVLGTPEGEHLRFLRFSGLSERQRGRFIDMLMGR
jgi:inner membrane protein